MIIFLAIAIPSLILILFGGLWLAALRDLHHAEQERDQLWDEHNEERP